MVDDIWGTAPGRLSSKKRHAMRCRLLLKLKPQCVSITTSFPCPVSNTSLWSRTEIRFRLYKLGQIRPIHERLGESKTMEGGIEGGLEPDASSRIARYLSSQFLWQLIVLNRILGPRRRRENSPSWNIYLCGGFASTLASMSRSDLILDSICLEKSWRTKRVSILAGGAFVFSYIDFFWQMCHLL